MARAKAKKEEPVEAGSDIAMDDAPTSHQPESRDDMSVDQDENDENEEMEDDEIEEEEEVQRVRLVCHSLHLEVWWWISADWNQLPGSTPTAASFEFLNEGHTLGNALRYIIMKK